MKKEKPDTLIKYLSKMLELIFEDENIFKTYKFPLQPMERIIHSFRM